MSRNRPRYRNPISLPLLLAVVITSSFVCARWVKEVHVMGQINRLSTQLRELTHSATLLDQDINDLRGREAALVSEDALGRSMAERGLELSGLASETIVHLGNDGSTNPTISTP